MQSIPKHTKIQLSKSKCDLLTRCECWSEVRRLENMKLGSERGEGLTLGMRKGRGRTKLTHLFGLFQYEDKNDFPHLRGPKIPHFQKESTTHSNYPKVREPLFSNYPAYITNIIKG